ncbi:hypothetical protein OEA41_004071 [Lepraria neglecta]|uniref:Uncharacterized protein n=1 Tax=Lepraria neglecta TaxID=209136 RepID=A0AAE0DJ06_9LECA|nr:hypothetical protein OEA41_004071 [Lepraria neglecta]
MHCSSDKEPQAFKPVFLQLWAPEANKTAGKKAQTPPDQSLAENPEATPPKKKSKNRNEQQRRQCREAEKALISQSRAEKEKETRSSVMPGLSSVSFDLLLCPAQSNDEYMEDDGTTEA